MVSGMTGLTAGAGGAGGGNNSAGSVHSASGKVLYCMSKDCNCYRKMHLIFVFPFYLYVFD